MSLETTIPNDLPPRTWKQWWRELPGWLRIAVWAMLACVVANVLLVIRVEIGLKEPTAIKSFRRPGVHIAYASASRVEPFPGFNQWADRLKGLSVDDVASIRLGELGTDHDLKVIGSTFRNLEHLYLGNSDITSKGLRELRTCKRLISLDLSNTDVDDDAIKPLAEMGRIGNFNLSGTLITDDSLPAMADMAKTVNGMSINVAQTSVSLAAVMELRANFAKAGISAIILTDRDSVPDGIVGSIRWADGTRSGRFKGAFVVGIEHIGGRSAHSSTKLTRNYLWWSPEQFVEDGDYKLTLKLGNHEAEPVPITVKDGKPSANLIELKMPVTAAEAQRR